MESRLAEVVDKTVIVEVDTELSLCSCESDVVDETCSLGGDDTYRDCVPLEQPKIKTGYPCETEPEYG